MGASGVHRERVGELPLDVWSVALQEEKRSGDEWRRRLHSSVNMLEC